MKLKKQTVIDIKEKIILKLSSLYEYSLSSI